MAFVDVFKHDIFISYAHLNNHQSDGAEGWVSRFHKRLEDELKQCVGKDLTIWRDTSLERNQVFDHTIKEAIDNSALFLTINSLAHKESPYCQQEILWFLERVQNDGWGLAFGDRKRILNALINNIPYGEWHPAFGGALAYNFYEDEPGGNIGFPADIDGPLLKKEMRNLVGNLYRTLLAFNEAIKKKQTQPVAQPQLNDNSRFTVFLADTSDEIQRTIRRRVIADLQKNKIRIADPVPPPLESDLHDQKAFAEIERSQLCLHLFDDSPGREIIDAPDQFYTHRQVQLAQQRPVRQLIWLPKAIAYDAIGYEPHRDFLQTLENAKRGASSYRFVREPLTADAVVREVLAIRDEVEHEHATKDVPSAAVLDAYIQDLSGAIASLSPKLEERNVKLELNYGEDEPRKNIELLVKKLKQTSRLILVFGQKNREWIEYRLREAIKICLEEESKLKPCAIYFAPPRNLRVEPIFDFGIIPVCQFDSSNLDNALMKWLSEG